MNRTRPSFPLALGLGLCVSTNASEILHKLQPLDLEANASFGRSTSIHGDYAVVGSVGAAYVFERSAGAWEPAAALQGGVGNGDILGSAVAVHGTTLVVSATDPTSGGAGSVYVFERVAAGWVETQRLVASDGAPQDDFGRNVDVHGDWIAVAAPYHDGEFIPAIGAVYLFQRVGGSWVEVSKISNEGNSYGFDLFGTSMDLDDGRIVIAAPNTNAGSTNNGRAELYDLTGGSWTFRQWIQPPDWQEPNLHYGAGVALDGERMVVTSPTGGYFGFGMLDLWERNTNGTYSLIERVFPKDVEAVDWGVAVGSSVAMSGDTIVSGSAHLAPFDGQGALHVVRELDIGVVPLERLTPPGAADGDGFGWSVAVHLGTAIVGAPWDDDLGVNSGAAWIVDTTTTPDPSLVSVVNHLFGGSSSPDNVQSLHLDAGVAHASKTYLLLGSLSGTAPGIALGAGHHLPLNLDSYLLFTLVNPAAGLLVPGTGPLDAAGRATCEFRPPSNTPSSILPIKLHHAFVVLEAPGSPQVAFASQAWPVFLH